MNDTLRAALAAGVMYVALFGFPGGSTIPSPVPRPAGPSALPVLTAAAGKMEAKDRAGLSDAMEQASIMLAADSAGLIKTTEDLQSFVRGTLGFGYSAFASQKYPEVSQLIQKELEAAVGTEIKAVDSAQRSSIAAKLKDIGEAIR